MSAEEHESKQVRARQHELRGAMMHHHSADDRHENSVGSAQNPAFVTGQPCIDNPAASTF
jgi:hypothetical protein